jgi:hypothetical protein
MTLKIALCIALIAGGAAPLAAQCCGDDSSGLLLDEEGNYVSANSSKAEPAQDKANKSQPPASASSTVTAPTAKTGVSPAQNPNLATGSTRKASPASPKS